MTNKITSTFSLNVALFIALVLISFRFGSLPANAALTNLPATVATTTLITFAAQTAISIEATSSCVARIISTTASPVMLTFSDVNGQVPTGTFGILQPASTTVAYDAGLYGCGLVRAFPFVTGNLTISDAR